MNPRGGGQGIKINGNQGGHQQNEGGISHIVQNPVFLQSREFQVFVHSFLSKSVVVGVKAGKKILAKIGAVFQMSQKLSGHFRVPVQGFVVQGHQLVHIQNAILVILCRNEDVAQLRLNSVQQLPAPLPVGTGQEMGAPGQMLHALADVCSGGRGIKLRHGHALPPGQPEPLAHVKGFRRPDPIQQKQPPLQLGLNGDVPYLPDAYQLVHIGMAGGIQAVVPQNPQQIGLRGLGIGLLAGLREEQLTAVGMVAVSQLAHGGVYGGIVVEENIRPMQTDVVESAEPTDALASLGGKFGQRQLAETVMGIIGGHGYHLVGKSIFLILHQFFAKGK